MSKENTLVKAINKNVRTSPRKLALVCNFIKGKKADVALKDLLFTHVWFFAWVYVFRRT